MEHLSREIKEIEYVLKKDKKKNIIEQMSFSDRGKLEAKLKRLQDAYDAELAKCSVQEM